MRAEGRLRYTELLAGGGGGVAGQIQAQVTEMAGSDSWASHRGVANARPRCFGRQ